MELFKFKGSRNAFTAYIVIDSLNNGYSFGGCRITVDVSEAEVVNLARCMTLKLAPYDLPVGGAKGGVRIASGVDRVQAMEEFGELARELLKTKVILGKDMGATDELMGALYRGAGIQQLYIPKLKSKGSMQIVPDRIQQLTGYISHMTGRGATWAAESACNGKMSGQRVLIQGAGAVGVGVAHWISQMGGRIIGISDRDIAVYCSEGLGFHELSLMTNNRAIDRTYLLGKSHLAQMAPNELLKQEADVVFLCAASNSVDEETAKHIHSPLVVEAANFALTDPARLLLHRQNVFVVPDVVASSSSAALVTLQMAAGNGLNAQEVWRYIEQTIKSQVRWLMSQSRTSSGHPKALFERMMTQKMAVPTAV